MKKASMKPAPMMGKAKGKDPKPTKKAVSKAMMKQNKMLTKKK